MCAFNIGYDRLSRARKHEKREIKFKIKSTRLRLINQSRPAPSGLVRWRRTLPFLFYKYAVGLGLGSCRATAGDCGVSRRKITDSGADTKTDHEETPPSVERPADLPSFSCQSGFR